MTESTHKLTGSQKQIEWAEDIRSAMIPHLDEIEKQTRAKAPEATRDILISIIENIRNQDSAEWWIDHRPDSELGDDKKTREVLAAAKARELITDEFKKR